jgi:hypothetical protein
MEGRDDHHRHRYATESANVIAHDLATAAYGWEPLDEV